MQKRTHICSFCLKGNDEVRWMVKNPDERACICDECVDFCYKSMQEKEAEKQ